MIRLGSTGMMRPKPIVSISRVTKMNVMARALGIGGIGERAAPAFGVSTGPPAYSAGAGSLFAARDALSASMMSMICTRGCSSETETS
jgi:hypothetical protein